MQIAGQALIKQKGYQQYEVSAYSLPEKACKHNLNYWEFGDYLGIGAGAHGKLTDIENGIVKRFTQVRHPKDFLNNTKRKAQVKCITESDLIFEFMLNALRLTNGVPSGLFIERTGLNLNKIQKPCADARKSGLMLTDKARLCASEFGAKYLNNLIGEFLL